MKYTISIAAAATALLLTACTPVPAPALAPTRHAPPRDGFQLHDRRVLGSLIVERWVPASSPEVSPAGMCECITLVYLGDRQLLTLGEPNLMTATTVEATSGKDITGDAQPEVVVSTWSGGAHCCYSTSIYSIGTQVRPVLNLDTGNCGPGELRDLDNDGKAEIITCDDRWGYAYCSFAESPFPSVVLAYNGAGGKYEVATPRFAMHLRDDIARQTAEARKKLAADQGKDLGVDKCTVLQPALSLMYAGLMDEGRLLVRALYRGADVDAFEKETLEKMRSSALWVAR